MFKLVCCPGYKKDVHWSAAEEHIRRPRHRHRHRHRRRAILFGPNPKRQRHDRQNEVDSINALGMPGKLTYEMGFHFYAKDLPPDSVHIWVEGGHVDLLVGPPEDHVGIANESSISFDLRRFQVNTDTNNEEHHPLNKNWRLKLATCPAAKLVIVEDIYLLPQLVWCSSCENEDRSAGLLNMHSSL